MTLSHAVNCPGIIIIIIIITIITDVVVCSSASVADPSKHPTSSDSSTSTVPVSQYSGKPQIYPVPPGMSTEPVVPDTVQSMAGFMPDRTHPYVQQIVQHVVEAAGPTAVYQPTGMANPTTFRPDSSAAFQTAAQSTLLLQHETNAGPTHFVLPTPAPPPMPPTFGPPLPQFVVGQPGPMERFSAPPPPPPPPGSVPCVSGINTGSGAVSYWMTLN